MGSARFIKGLLFAWIPLLLFIIPAFFTVFRGISSQKATGLGAVAGGLAEYLVTIGLVSVVASEVYAVVLLTGTFSRQEVLRSTVAMLSIACGVLFLIVIGVAIFAIMRFRIMH